MVREVRGSLLEVAIATVVKFQHDCVGGNGLLENPAGILGKGSCGNG